LAESRDVLEQLADEAISEHRAGRTKPLHPRKRWSRLRPSASGRPGGTTCCCEQ
jgi:hypothetical protein